MKYVTQITCTIVLLLLLQGCANPVTVYRDGPSIGEQVPVQADADSPQLAKSIATLGYPIWLGRSAQGQANEMMLVGHYYRDGDWDRQSVDYDEFRRKERLVESLNNATLGAGDVTVIEIVIAGLSNGQLTRVSKRFTGPVAHFNWVKLFEGRVPRDSKGYLLEVDVALNYLHEPGYEDHKQYFVHMPAYYHFYPVRDDAFGSVASAPFLNFTFKENSRLIDYDYIAFNTRETRNHIDGGRDFYNASRLTLGTGKTHEHFFYMNPVFLEQHGMLEGSNTALQREAIHSVYKDEAEVESLIQALEDIYLWAQDIGSQCSFTADQARRSASSFAKLSGRGMSRIHENKRQTVIGLRRKYDHAMQAFDTSKAALAHANRFMADRASARQAIDAREESLTRLHDNMTAIAERFPYAAKECAQVSSAIDSLDDMSVSSSGGASFLSALGGALSKELASSYQPGYRHSDNYSGGSNSVADTMKQFHVDLKRNYETIMELQKQQQAAKNASYQALLRGQGSSSSSTLSGSTQGSQSKAASSSSSSASRQSSHATASSTRTGSPSNQGSQGACESTHSFPSFSVEGRATSAQSQMDAKLKRHMESTCGVRGVMGGTPGQWDREVLKERTKGTAEQDLIRITASGGSFKCGCGDGSTTRSQGSPGAAR